MSSIWKYLKAEPFFSDLCPDIKRYKQKVSGMDSRGNKLDFTDADNKVIIKKLKFLVKTFEEEARKKKA